MIAARAEILAQSGDRVAACRLLSDAAVVFDDPSVRDELAAAAAEICAQTQR